MILKFFSIASLGFGFIGTLCAVTTALAAPATPAKTVREACKTAYNKDIQSIYEGTNAESVRMSSRFNMTPVASKNEDLELYTISVNFYVKWPENSREVAELSGGRMIFDKTTGQCQSVSLMEFIQFSNRDRE
ncbi:MAG: hypothetical protein RBT63_06105 [Bdellovibrionales bacterium]|nr:hypothetical protein [Bdellovibrionales bacterium]